MTYKLTCCDDGSGLTVGTLIKFDNVTILLDPGWFPGLVSVDDTVKYWSNIIADVDIIILSQPTKECLGAYSLLYVNFLSHFISRIEVYATLPIANLGRVATIDLYASQGVIGPYLSNIMDVDDVEKSFDCIKTLKYSQVVDLRYKFEGLTFVAYNSGSAPGGSIWCISTYVEKLVYVKRWNHTKNNLLNAASIWDSGGKPISALSKPSAIITTFDKLGSTKPLRRRTKEFRDILTRSLQSSGSLLIPVDIGGDFLNLFVSVQSILLTTHRGSRKYGNIPILFISYARGRTLTYAKSMLEWFSSESMKNWETKDNQSPFDIDNRLHFISPNELSKYPGSKICLVSNMDALLNETILKLYKTENLNVILTDGFDSDATMISTMLQKWNKSCLDNSNILEGDMLPFSQTVPIKVWTKQALKSDALDTFKNQIEKRRLERSEKEATLKRDAKTSANGPAADAAMNGNGSLAVGQNGIGINDDDDDDDDDNDVLSARKSDGKNNSKGAKFMEPPVDLYLNENSKQKMFLFNPKREKRDDYGIMVDFSMFAPKDDEIVETSDVNISSKEVPSHVSKKRRKNSNKKDLEQPKAENFDNIDYLDTLNQPCKLRESTKEIQLKCSFTYINMTSLSDQRSTTVILPSLMPRKLILLAPASKQPKNVCSVFTNKNIEVLLFLANKETKITTVIKALDISIDTELDQLLRWQRIGGDHTVAHVIGRLVKTTATTHTKGNNPDSTRSKLILKPLEKNPLKISSGGTLSIGDVRLVELKRKLTEENHVAEFKGEGTLIVDGQVAVRKVSDGETIIDGTPSDIFDIVKSHITGMLAKI
ncbi:cleavage polyadenylation factor subunit CFT2 KNAG_0G02340 [Huiozyma naganishii CBS 8797]|uniref:Cleavage and polyadenylation specificity factor subunit 2 n=1 Tax=Huiozyma naganishii (strain ATCC MYA-139 / BCRC 22969 / CBS 8797 / KCTC 17520 / NBRC 10181 / NCYC 3082 / Yp74L-3) TaxID=1071383 RepID=J7S145_HUIN7|nr:hypothetical protein KNAG_0G02340 [Kazachstania naganishii CBS 8797]CCK71292.1 hypothetical protein KNAG_0G02340 [Kazachstania naganishii CBS 8797]